VSSEDEEVIVSVGSFHCKALRCRICEREYELAAVGVCSRCFGPLDPVYDETALHGSLSREAIESGPSSLWRYAPLLPVARPRSSDSRPGSRRSLPPRALAAALGIGRCT
jgi:threonine synthase